MTAQPRYLITAALPYANGSVHLGHLVEYCHADIYVRALKRLGEDACYICANDAHGTPIELHAKKLQVTPENLVQAVHQEQKVDFARFDIQFDNFGTTHSNINQDLVQQAYAQLKNQGDLEIREIDGNWCEQDARFLPDRFIKGSCPRCQAKDQYGDVCEACGATYAPTELVAPYCVLCGKPPIVKQSSHVFFKLSARRHVDFLRQYIDSGALQPDVANHVRTWIDNGLKDWCISRDGPYFGFKILDMPNKFFYVWLDAPFGYMASSLEWGALHGLGVANLWHSKNTRIEHIIGKDIVYFHALFWPAVLHALGYELPSRLHVHGMLTINGEKMSKSRGTFINAAVFAKYIDPQALRYYYACKYSAQTDDMDLSFADFLQRINTELVNKHANLFSRASQFLHQKLDARLSDLPFTKQEAQQPANADAQDTSLLNLARRVVAHAKRVEILYRQREFGQVIRELCSIADIGNETMQARKPWEELKTDPESARLTCTFALNICHALAMYLWPIIPRFAEAGAALLGSNIERMDATQLFQERQRSIGPWQRLFERIESSATNKIIADSAPKIPTEPQAAQAQVTPIKDTIDIKTFARMDLRIGLVLEAEAIPKSRKLLRLQVDLGEDAPRQIIAGLAEVYQPEALVGKKLVVLANLAPANIMGYTSYGMVMAAENDNNVGILSPMADLPPGSIVR